MKENCLQYECMIRKNITFLHKLLSISFLKLHWNSNITKNTVIKKKVLLTPQQSCIILPDKTTQFYVNGVKQEANKDAFPLSFLCFMMSSMLC